MSIAKRVFTEDYEIATKGSSIAYDRDCDLLYLFASRITKGDRRLFIDLDRLSMLKTWERAHANPKGRDHFFHTFNNLFLGYLVLGAIQKHITVAADVDDFVVDSGTISKLHAWEILWFITC